ncbi:hypothetical protein NEOKW01_0020 [Nematocida sp. AWRm80]|nr:hypothetical protein NEOKW01_0020 [Nematocida sp. AWRm80]
MAAGTEETLTDSKNIQANILKAMDSFEDKLATFDEILSKIKQSMPQSFIDYLNSDNTIIKEKEFQEDITLYKYGICNAIEITKETEENASGSVLNKFMANPQVKMTDEEKDSLVKVLEQQISHQLDDMILGLSDVREKLKGKNDAMRQFDDLATACSESSEMVKAHIINKLEAVIKEINEKDIEGIDYKSIGNIEEIDTKEILGKWGTIISPFETIVKAEYLFIDSRLKSKSIKKDIRQQTDLKYGLRYFKTVANHLPELVNQKYSFPHLSAIHSDEDQFFKRFTRSELKKIPEDQLAEEINKQYETALRDSENTPASSQDPSLLDKFKSVSPQTRLLIVIVIIIVAIVASLLLFYFLSSKDTVNQVVV